MCDSTPGRRASCARVCVYVCVRVYACACVLRCVCVCVRVVVCVTPHLVGGHLVRVISVHHRDRGEAALLLQVALNTGRKRSVSHVTKISQSRDRAARGNILVFNGVRRLSRHATQRGFA